MKRLRPEGSRRDSGGTFWKDCFVMIAFVALLMKYIRGCWGEGLSLYRLYLKEDLSYVELKSTFLYFPLMGPICFLYNLEAHDHHCPYHR